VATGAAACFAVDGAAGVAAPGAVPAAALVTGAEVLTGDVNVAVGAFELFELGNMPVIAATPTKLTSITDIAAAATNGWIRFDVLLMLLVSIFYLRLNADTHSAMSMSKLSRESCAENRPGMCQM
jgi:hypothetical protein